MADGERLQLDIKSRCATALSVACPPACATPAVVLASCGDGNSADG